MLRKKRGGLFVAQLPDERRAGHHSPTALCGRSACRWNDREPDNSISRLEKVRVKQANERLAVAKSCAKRKRTLDIPEIFLADRQRIALIAESYLALLGRPLVAAGDTLAMLWNCPSAIVAHDTEADPVFFGNRAALAVFETKAEAFVLMPSRLSAEAPLRAERQALLDRVSRFGFIDDYAGIRISALGRRFPISGAAVWELVDATGRRRGQAACFAVRQLADN